MQLRLATAIYGGRSRHFAAVRDRASATIAPRVQVETHACSLLLARSSMDLFLVNYCRLVGTRWLSMLVLLVIPVINRSTVQRILTEYSVVVLYSLYLYVGIGKWDP